MGAGEGFKIVPLGFDKNDVNSYISELNKKMAKCEADMAANNTAMAEAKRLAEDVDARIKAAVSEKDAKINDLNEKLLNERRGVDTYKVQIEELQQQLRDKEKEMQNMSVSNASANDKKSKSSGESAKKANADAAKIIADAKAEAEKIIMLAEGEKIRTQESLTTLLSTLTIEFNKMNSSYKEIFSAASFLDGVKAPEMASPVAAVEKSPTDDFSDFAAFMVPETPAAEAETAEEASSEAPVADGLFEWDGSVDLREGLGISSDVDENDIIGSVSFGEEENKGFNVIEQSASSAMDSLNPADFAGVDMSDSINDAWSGFAEEKPSAPALSDSENNELGIEWVGMKPTEAEEEKAEEEIDEMSTIADDLFNISGDEEMTTEIADNSTPDIAVDEKMFAAKDFDDFLSMTQSDNKPANSDGMGTVGIAPVADPIDTSVSIEPLVSYLDQDSSKLYDASFDNELVAQTMPVNDISGLSGAVNEELMEAAKTADSAATEQPAADDSPWLQLQKELEEMEKLGAFNESESADTAAASEPATEEEPAETDPFAAAESTTDLMWDMGTDKSEDDDDEMSTTTSGFTF